jgi:N-methylhydantoinase A
MTRWRLGVDVGGTFTDFSLLNVETGALLIEKVPTTPRDPALGIIEGLKTLATQGVSGADILSFLHGTTITTNALIEKKGARIGLLLTGGLRGIVEVQTGDRRGNTYNLAWEKPDPLALRELTFEIPERIGSHGEVVRPLDEEAVRSAARALGSAGPEAVAVCYLFSYANPAHEQRTRELIDQEAPGCLVSLSSEILPRIREWPRMSTTLLNAYLEPALVRYIRSLREQMLAFGVVTDQLYLMQSNGGVMPFDAVLAGGNTIHTLLSGPAGGVRAGARFATAAGIDRAVTMDIGGTSCDIAFIENGRALEVTEGEVSDYPVAVPMIDITTIGAGGGTVAWLDRGGGLNLGPRSAGAEPGPVCYGHGGTEVTVTDANLVLGYLNADFFLGGRVRLDRSRAEEALRTGVGEPLGLSATQAASAIVQIINVRMADKIRVLAAQRALSLPDFTLMAGGGAGPVHATRVAEELGIAEVLVPPSPGAFSALGLLCTDITHDYVRTEVASLAELAAEQIEARFHELGERARQELKAEGLSEAGATFIREFDLRYAGQGYEIRVPVEPSPPGEAFKPTIAGRFHEMHEHLRGHRAEEEPIEVVSYRLRVQVDVPQYQPPRQAVAAGGSPVQGTGEDTREVQFAGEAAPVAARIYRRDGLTAGFRTAGPAIVEQHDATTVIPPGWACRVDEFGSLRLTREVPADRSQAGPERKD